MIIPSNKRICTRAALRGLGAANFFSITGGPQGSTTMLVACVFQLFKAGNAFFFGGTNLSAGVGGWGLTLSGNVLGFIAVNGASVVISHQAVAGAFDTAVNFNIPIVFIAQLVGGQMTSSVSNRVAAAPTALVGYTPKPAGQTVRIGVDASGTMPGAGLRPYELSDCLMFDGYDGTGFVSSVYGNGIAGINAMWQEDIQQGRYLTPPRVAVPNSDWYWSARDVLSGPGAKSSWTDRFTAAVMTRSGSPQAAQIMGRF